MRTLRWLLLLVLVGLATTCNAIPINLPGPPGSEGNFAAVDGRAGGDGAPGDAGLGSQHDGSGVLPADGSRLADGGSREPSTDLRQGE